MARVPPELTRQREELAWDLAAKGLSDAKIAVEISKAGLGEITYQGVNKMLRRVEDRFFREMTERIAGVKASQTKALMTVYREAMDAWERSKQTSKTLTKQVDGGGGPGGAGGAERVTTQLRDQDGDPRFLAEARAALADLRKIWGADAPQKVAPTTPEGDKPFAPKLDLSQATVEELRAIRDIRRKLLERRGDADERGGAGPPAGGKEPL